MEDLLNEEEFIPKKDSFNPWKGFMFFYGIATLHFAIGTYLGKFIKGTAYSSLYSLFFSGIIIMMPFIMFFSRRKNIRLLKRTIVTAVFGLTSLYFCLTVAVELIADSDYMMMRSASFTIWAQLYAITFVYGMICSAIILLIRWFKLKKLKPQLSSL